MGKSNDRNKRNDNRGGFKVPDEVKRLANLEFKKFKKKNSDYYDSKKELKKAYCAEIIDMLPEAITTLVKYGHFPDMKETKEAIYTKLTDAEFVKYLKKELKNEVEFDNMELLPVIINDIVKESNKHLAALKAENPEATIEIDLAEVVEISSMILKKKMKKMVKAGIDEAVAFDLLSVIPDMDILKGKGQGYRLSQFFAVVYDHSKEKEVDFSKVMKVMFKDDQFIGSVITFALLERKEKIGNFTDTQKNVFNAITEYCFKTLEDMDKEDIMAILKAYCDSRRRDEQANKDTNRRYYISQLPEADYPKICKVVERMVDRDENMKKYF